MDAGQPFHFVVAYYHPSSTPRRYRTARKTVWGLDEHHARRKLMLLALKKGFLVKEIHYDNLGKSKKKVKSIAKGIQSTVKSPVSTDEARQIVERFVALFCQYQHRMCTGLGDNLRARHICLELHEDGYGFVKIDTESTLFDHEPHEIRLLRAIFSPGEMEIEFESSRELANILMP